MAGPSASQPAPAPTQPVLAPSQPASLSQPPVAPSNTIEERLSLILARLGTLETEMTGSFANLDVTNAASRQDHAADMLKLTEALESSRERHKSDCRELQVTKQELVVVKEQCRRLEVQVNHMVNRQNICNLRLDGMKEDSTENLKSYIIDLAHAMGVKNMAPHDIVSTYRIGKVASQQQGARARARTVVVTFVNERARNAFFFARSTLKGQDRYRGVFINDDATPVTRKQRDDYRAVAALARQDGVDVRVHTDGLLLAGKKYLLTEPKSLPDQYSVEKAKTYEHGGEIYFASESSFLSNFSPSPIVEGDDTFITAEHMYQTLKCRHAQAHDRASAVIAAPTPLEAKKLADSLGDTPEWRQVRDGIMQHIISEKFKQNPKLARKLLATGDLPLNEATHNNHFGIGVTLLAREIRDKSYRGINKLGQILVAERATIKAATANN